MDEGLPAGRRVFSRAAREDPDEVAEGDRKLKSKLVCWFKEGWLLLSATPFLRLTIVMGAAMTFPSTESPERDIAIGKFVLRRPVFDGHSNLCGPPDVGLSGIPGSEKAQSRHSGQAGDS